jgi:hypothetical protein
MLRRVGVQHLCQYLASFQRDKLDDMALKEQYKLQNNIKMLLQLNKKEAIQIPCLNKYDIR